MARLEGWAAATGQLAAVGAVWQCRALMGDPDAAELLAAAADAFRGAHSSYEEAHAALREQPTGNILGRGADSMEIARSILFLASDDASYLITSEWSDEDAFKSFIQSQAFRDVTNWGKEQILSGRPQHKVYKH